MASTPTLFCGCASRQVAHVVGQLQALFLATRPARSDHTDSPSGASIRDCPNPGHMGLIWLLFASPIFWTPPLCGRDCGLNVGRVARNRAFNAILMGNTACMHAHCHARNTLFMLSTLTTHCSLILSPHAHHTRVSFVMPSCTLHS